MDADHVARIGGCPRRLPACELPACLACSPLAAHTGVFLLLVTQGERVARESLMAMTIRMAVWIVIVILATVQRHRQRRPAAEGAQPQPA
jgi:hypothetical protein